MRLMTHVVVGYPTLALCEQVVDVLAKSGSEFIELQIPFSDPVADGPTIAAANDVALRNGVTIEEALSFAEKVARKHPHTQFYFMSYLNPILAAGGAKFFARAAAAGIRGFIIPDLPIEEANELLQAAKKYDLNIIFVVAPNTSPTRLRLITSKAQGFLYCVARLGVTGKTTQFSADLKTFLTRVKKLTRLPLAVGFGVANMADATAIQKAGGDVVVIGSAIIRAHQEKGVDGVTTLIKSLLTC